MGKTNKRKRTNRTNRTKKNNKKQKTYKMKGCSKGGSNLAYTRAYPSAGSVGSNNFINFYPGKGGSCGVDSCSILGGSQNGGSSNPALIGSPWTSDPKTWPGVVDSTVNNGNHFPLNKYSPVDISREMQSIGAQPPFLGIGGKSKNMKKIKQMRKKTLKNKIKQKGSGLSNFLYQDLVNLGRQFQYNLGSSYNTVNGYSHPVNPLPWKDQLSHSNRMIR